MNSLKAEVIDAMVAAGMTSALLAPEHGSGIYPQYGHQEGAEAGYHLSGCGGPEKTSCQPGRNWIMGFPEDTNETLQETMDMIDELQLDRNWVGALIPFPGTPIFDQCVRDNLFIDGIDTSNLWREPVRAHQEGCVIKPYNMTLEDLFNWRRKFIDIRFKYMRQL
jgi:hypothetical protein